MSGVQQRILFRQEAQGGTLCQRTRRLLSVPGEQGRWVRRVQDMQYSLQPFTAHQTAEHIQECMSLLSFLKKIKVFLIFLFELLPRGEHHFGLQRVQLLDLFQLPLPLPRNEVQIDGEAVF